MENSDETESAPPTINDLLELVYGVMDTLDKQKTSGEPLKFKEKALSQLDHIQERLYEFEAAQPATNARLDLIERKLEKIDSIESKLEAIKEATNTSFKEIKEATTNSEKSWAQIAATNTTTASATTKAAIQAKRRDLQETLRKQREPYQVTLTTTDKESQKTITDMHPYQINKRCQDIINTETDEKPKLNGISKITNGIRLQCKSPEDANILRMLNWNSAFEGLRIHKQKCGIVVHGVSVDEMEALANGDTKAATLKEWEEANGIKLGTVKPLRRKPRANRIPPPHQSIPAYSKKETDESPALDVEVEVMVEVEMSWPHCLLPRFPLLEEVDEVEDSFRVILSSGYEPGLAREPKSLSEITTTNNAVAIMSSVNPNAEETYKVELLQGSANYRTWKFSMRMVLQARDLWEVVSGEEVKTEAAAQAWEKKARKALATIALALSAR